jgi:dethiobiotin synthetase
MRARARGVFVTGTDTGVGKTLVCAALIRTARAQGIDARGMKPVASGCETTAAGLRNADALALIDAMGAVAPDYATVNPWAIGAPIAPHLAAAADGVVVTLDPILSAYQRLAAESELVIVEGAGGWAIPLSDTLMQADLPRALGLPVLLVVGVRLGCINHAILSARTIRSDGLALAGWIANTIDPELPRGEEAVATITRLLGVAPLAYLPYAPTPAPMRHALAPVLRALLPADTRSR